MMIGKRYQSGLKGFVHLQIGKDIWVEIQITPGKGLSTFYIFYFLVILPAILSFFTLIPIEVMARQKKDILMFHLLSG